MTSFNRNFKNRNDGNSTTMNFLTSPEVNHMHPTRFLLSLKEIVILTIYFI